MNGGHDLGGMDGLGPIQAEAETEEPVFHYEWEKTAFAHSGDRLLGDWNIDTSRFARERQHPVAYLSNTYYQIGWLAWRPCCWRPAWSPPRNCGLVSPRSPLPPICGKGLTPAKVAETLGRGGPSSHPVDTVPEFAIGQRASDQRPSTGHAHAPRYVRGHVAR